MLQLVDYEGPTWKPGGSKPILGGLLQKSLPDGLNRHLEFDKTFSKTFGSLKCEIIFSRNDGELSAPRSSEQLPAEGKPSYFIHKDFLGRQIHMNHLSLHFGRGTRSDDSEWSVSGQVECFKEGSTQESTEITLNEINELFDGEVAFGATPQELDIRVAGLKSKELGHILDPKAMTAAVQSSLADVGPKGDGSSNGEGTPAGGAGSAKL